MSHKEELAPVENIGRAILFIRGEKVILDEDLARLYGTTTKRLNEQVRRNIGRFPEDFMFRLTAKEYANVRSSNPECTDLTGRGGRRYMPLAFTEHGAIMAAALLNTPVAIEISIFVVRAFIHIRRLISTQDDLVRKIDSLEQKYDAQFKVVFDAIRQLMAPPTPKKNEVGFHWEIQDESTSKKAPAKKKTGPAKKIPAKQMK